jgi:hypothetical protein
MPTARPFAYNPGSTIAGTEQVGDIAVGVSPEDYSGGYGGVRWWNGAPLSHLGTRPQSAVRANFPEVTARIDPL